MNVALGILQVLLALHTVMGALWKFSTPVARMGSLSTMPQAVWVGLGGLELVAAVALVLPLFKKPLSRVAAVGAGFVVAEMVLFCGVHFASGATEHGEVGYWLVVAALCGLVVYGRGRVAAR